ncbi:adenosylcobinamide-phosphate synthase CbiB [Candidatus Thiosymbion oneisti]|uniref:adenosylcobinamide-phosphate synthase CbiB n=1 Tax=Candidatus Thiosymbion oneisti TaxID=589554 RepID=UPI000B043BA4|nr:adenosylcobinamide-phosphate synthase CbiB [Candidatus Thiosymbion oneisti]
MELIPHLALVLAACVADGLFGDPVYKLHPIRLLGAWSLLWEKLLLAGGLNGHLGGIIHWALVVGAALLAWWALHRLLVLWHPWAAWAWDACIAYSLLCLRDLLAHGRRVLTSLDDLPEARRQVAMLVGRDTQRLDPGGVVRATIESLSENLTDGVLTPLWALCLFGLPGLILVKAVSSLDSMVGYRNERYRRFGWAAARSDDLVHWLPARLSVPLIALAAVLLRLHPRLAFSAARRWHRMLASPNSGWSEAACAGALRVRLIGPISYQGRGVNEAFMGDEDWPANLEGSHLDQALRLTLVCGLLALAFGLGFILCVHLLWPWMWNSRPW